MEHAASQIDRLMRPVGTNRPHVFESSGEGAFCVCGWVKDAREANHVTQINLELLLLQTEETEDV
jgi:hypothetical protein